MLRLNGGQFEGLPFKLLPFEEFIIGSIFGWLSTDGFRRFRTAFVEIGKGNGKSPLAAGVGLYCLTADDEQRAEVYSAASKKDQAMILFRDAVAMVDQSPDLRARLTKTPQGPACYHLGYPHTTSFFKAISSEDGQSGPRPHCFLIDELHEHTSPIVINMASAGHKWRRQPLTFAITNSGFDKLSVCYQWHEYSIRVAEGSRADDQWFSYVCAHDEGEEPFDDESVWVKTNPGLGKIIKKGYLRKQIREAEGMPAQASTVRRLNFCQWTDAENPWISSQLWLACEREFDALAALAECAEVVGALDLSGVNDLTALALVGQSPDSVPHAPIARVEFWTPGDTIVERGRRDKVEYDVWVRQGYLNAPPGRAIDMAFVAQRLVDLQALLPTFRRCAFDPYRIKYLEVELDRLGADIELIPHPQGYYKAAARKDDQGEELPVLWMPRSIEVLSKHAGAGTLTVEKNPVLTMNSAAAVLEADSKNNKIFTKRKSRGRIDGIVALAMAIGALYDTEADDAGSLDDFLDNPIHT